MEGKTESQPGYPFMRWYFEYGRISKVQPGLPNPGKLYFSGKPEGYNLFYSAARVGLPCSVTLPILVMWHHCICTLVLGLPESWWAGINRILLQRSWVGSSLGWMFHIFPGAENMPINGKLRVWSPSRVVLPLKDLVQYCGIFFQGVGLCQLGLLCCSWLLDLPMLLFHFLWVARPLGDCFLF